MKSFDECIIQTIEIMESLEGINEEMFTQTFAEETFTTRDTSGRTLELVTGGSSIMLTYRNAPEYAKLVEQIRLNEGQVIYEWLRKGMSAVIPLSILNLFTWKQVENLVCGAPDIDVNKLKEKTQL